MRFMMFVCSDPEPGVRPEEAGDIDAWVHDVDSRGVRIVGDRLRPAADAKTVKIRGGRKMIHDGPFTESKEVILGFDILECASLDEAVEIAARHPMAYAGRIEVRAFWPFED